METMKTYRMVADGPRGAVCIDVIIRGPADAVEDTAPDGVPFAVRKWLDYDCGFAGSWVDQGTARTWRMLGVRPSSPCAHDGAPFVLCRHCGELAIVDAHGPAPSAVGVDVPAPAFDSGAPAIERADAAHRYGDAAGRNDVPGPAVGHVCPADATHCPACHSDIGGNPCNACGHSREFD